MTDPASYSHDDFVHEYECVVNREFAFNGHTSTWAPSHDGPRFWDEEDKSIDLPRDVPLSGLGSATILGLTSDGKYLAVAVNTIVRLYDVETLELRAETEGYPSNVESMSFQPQPRGPSLSAAEDAKYVLVSQNLEHQDFESKVYKTVFDCAGRRVNDGTSFPIAMSNGMFPRYGSQIWRPDGVQLLYVMHQTSKEMPPQVVITNLATGVEASRLQGHKDVIMWASWSPDGTIIATASQDRTFGLWVAVSGVRRHTIGTNGQRGCGAFFSDGKHILLSEADKPAKFGVYEVQSADLVVALQPPENIRLDPWLYDFAVHPSRELIILRNGRSLLAWTPFESDGEAGHPAVQILLALQLDSNAMSNSVGALRNLRWIDRGRKLVALGEDQTVFVWEPQRRLKWRFQRPRGRAVDDYNEADVLLVKRKAADWVVSVGENRLRLWKL